LGVFIGKNTLSKEGIMRGTKFLVCLLVFLPALASAQEKKEKGIGQGYAYVAPGGSYCGGSNLSTLQFGGGGDAVFYKGVGFGADIGYMAPARSLGDGIGILSLNGLYQASSSKKISPFVTGGYSLAFRSGSASGFNLGGGIHYWLTDHQGLRIEFRDHLFWDCHFWQFRIGVDFR
jgi:hypothetical protein